jgi:hypothetical protein
MNRQELEALFKGEGFARLVMAGGGVPRDVLSLFLESMSQSEGEAVGKDEVRVLSRSNLERRIEELKQDSQIDEQSVLIAGIYVLREFCLSRKTNVFLVPEQLLQQEEEWKTLFSRLVDYRIIHQAGTALTHKSQPGNYQAFAIDIGCYAHFRKMEGRFNEIDVSKAAAKDQMRSAPVLSSGDLQALFKSVPPNVEQILKAPVQEDAENLVAPGMTALWEAKGGLGRMAWSLAVPDWQDMIRTGAAVAARSPATRRGRSATGRGCFRSASIA